MVLPCLDPTTGIRIDFIFSFTPNERQAIDRAAKISIGKTQVRFATVEDLIVHKMLAERTRDHEDVTGILLKQPRLDLAYVRHWLAQFATTVNQPLTEQFETLLKNIR
jgi:predicted nucleotidyltransferase